MIMSVFGRTVPASEAERFRQDSRALRVLLRSAGLTEDTIVDNVRLNPDHTVSITYRTLDCAYNRTIVIRLTPSAPVK